MMKSRRTVGRVVERLRTSSIPSTDIGAFGNQLYGDVLLIGRRYHVQSSIALVHVVLDLVEEVCPRN
jgi:hypothetical protein